MKDEKITITADDLINSSKSETFSENLRRLVNSPLTQEAHDRMAEVECLFGVPLDTIKSAMNAVLVMNSLKGSEKSYELIVRMMNEDPTPQQPQTQNLFILPTSQEQDAISRLLSDNNNPITIDEMAVPSKRGEDNN